MVRNRGFAALCTLACACATAPSPVKKPPAVKRAAANAPVPPPTPPVLKLGTSVHPIRYAAELHIDPKQEPFTGTVDIDVDIREPTAVIWLNATELTVIKANAQRGTDSFPAEVLSTPKDFLGLAFESPLGPGTARLHIEYSGRLGTKEVQGPSRQSDNNQWYVYTQFEPIDARRAYPCFDEPAFKVPWQLTLDVPSSDQAFSNTPVTSEYETGDGLKQVKFAPTAPLPSYLTAWAVGPFEVVDGGKSPRSGTPVRVIMPQGHRGEGDWAAESTAPIVGQLEDYFGTHYPYQKLDAIAVPFFDGAMENPGLVTFSQRIILRRPDTDNTPRRRDYAQVAAHELAHQWFGDWVTMAWWDDLWLNEAFATWMELKIIDQWQPKWNAAEDRMAFRSWALEADTLLSARKIRQPIASDDDIENAFDRITYLKGSIVIAMFEQWVGVDVFRRGVQRYLHSHENKNGTAAEFLGAISMEARRDIAPAFSTFLEQTGAPLVSMKVNCQKGQPASLEWSQRRYLPVGQAATAELEGQLWQIPISVRWGGSSAGGATALLSGRTGSVPLAGLTGCPEWFLPNAAGTGYYRSALSEEPQSALFHAPAGALSIPERLAVISDALALTRAGLMPYSRLLAEVPKWARDPNPHIVRAAIGVVGWLRDTRMVPESQKTSYAKLIRDSFGKQARALGWQSRPRDDEDTKILRRALVPLVASQGEDAQLLAQARTLTSVWLGNRSSVDSEMVDPILTIAAEHGDAALFERLHRAAAGEPERASRQRLLSAMSAFRDPVIAQKSMAIAMSDEFDPRESFVLLTGPARVPQTQLLAYDFLKAKFDPLVARLPRDYGAWFPFLGAALCDDEHQADVEDFFAKRAAGFTGGPRLLRQALEQMHLCVALRKAQEPSIEDFLQKSAHASARSVPVR